MISSTEEGSGSKFALREDGDSELTNCIVKRKTKCKSKFALREDGDSEAFYIGTAITDALSLNSLYAKTGIRSGAPKCDRPAELCASKFALREDGDSEK